MTEQRIDTRAAGQMELEIAKFETFGIIPEIAEKLFPDLLEKNFPSARAAQIIESEPALTAQLLFLIHKGGLSLSDYNYSVGNLLQRLPAEQLRNHLLSVKIDWNSGTDYQSSNQILVKDLIAHSIAAACFAERVAEKSNTEIPPKLAYITGLLHDIGKFVLMRMLPKGLEKVTSQSRTGKTQSRTAEKNNLGLDHTIVGKRLGQKWHFDEKINLGIWLHHSDVTAMLQNLPGAEIAAITQLADSLAHRAKIGDSGSYHRPQSIEIKAEMLGISSQQLEDILKTVPQQIRQKTQNLNPGPAGVTGFFDKILAAAANLSSENKNLAQSNQKLQTTAAHIEFLKEYLSVVDTQSTVAAAAQAAAQLWQRFYQTGRVCLYLTEAKGDDVFFAAVAEGLGRTRTVLLNKPKAASVIFKQIPRQFEILDAWENSGWLFEQLDVDFDTNQSKVVPLLSGDRAIGVIIFELRYPADAELLRENFETTSRLAASVLEILSISQSRQKLSELLVESITAQQGTIAEKQTSQTTALFGALAEMAAGAAHELNNPLTVISGQAQMLAKEETSEQKTQILKKIERNCRRLSEIIDGLMSFAEPDKPRPSRTNIRQILDESAQLAARKSDTARLDMNIDITDDAGDVYVDSAQIASALGNVFSNCIESYRQTAAPVKVMVSPEAQGRINIEIRDFGCGMDAETLRKATLPFFSAKLAGRQTGMGLAYAVRLIELNRGSFRIGSKPNEGTVATISLPAE